MSQCNIAELFDNSRWPSGVPLLLTIIYFPFGLFLVVLRSFIGLHTFIVCCLMPKLAFIRSIVLRLMCAILGIVVSVDSTKQQKRDVNAKVMVANYTSTLDHLAVDLIQPSILPCVWDLPPSLMWLLGYVDMGAKKSRDTLIENAKTHCNESKVPLLIFPEGASTNGKKGLLKFSTWPFSLDESVQPVLIQIKRPFIARLSPSILGGRWWRDVFWTLFVPYTSFHIRFLPSEVRGENETIEDFTKRVQFTMAAQLGLQATTHTTVDKVEYAKRKLFVQTAPNHETKKQTFKKSTSVTAEVDENMSVMIRQVQEVLPHISAPVIQQDLTLTKDVDLTITNILEGKTPEDTQITSTTSSSSSNNNKMSLAPSPSAKSAPSPSKAFTAASSFSRSSNQRHSSLSERKQALIDFARQKYIEKHEINT